MPPTMRMKARDRAWAPREDRIVVDGLEAGLLLEAAPLEVGLGLLGYYYRLLVGGVKVSHQLVHRGVGQVDALRWIDTSLLVVAVVVVFQAQWQNNKRILDHGLAFIIRQSLVGTGTS